MTEDITDFPIDVTIDGQEVEISKIENGTVTAVAIGETTPGTVMYNAKQAMPSGAEIKSGTTEETGIVM